MIYKYARYIVMFLSFSLLGCGEDLISTLLRIEITPVTNNITVGLTQQLTAKGINADGSSENISSLVTWKSNDTAIVSINASGLITAKAAGKATIIATKAGISSSPVTVTVTTEGAALVSMSLSHTNLILAHGSTQQLTATGTYSDGSSANITSGVTWQSNHASIASINANGLTTASGVGNTIILAIKEGVNTLPVTVTVEAAALVTLTLSPSSVSLSNGSTQQLTATGTYTNGSSVNISSAVTWQSNNAGIVSFNASGLATGNALGSTTVFATKSGINSNSIPVTITLPLPTAFNQLDIQANSLAGKVKTFIASWEASTHATTYTLCKQDILLTNNCKIVLDGITSTSIEFIFDELLNDTTFYFIMANNATGNTLSNSKNITASAMIAAMGYFKASNTGSGDSFGSSVSLSTDGNTLVVGASSEFSAATGINNLNPGQADNTEMYSGAVYIYTRAANIWSQQAYIKASNTGEFDRFGASVTLSADGNTLAVGATAEDSAAVGVNNLNPGQADNTLSNAGAVYVFTRAGSTWTQQAYVKASNAGAQDIFGFAISLSSDGNTLAVGAYAEASAATGINNISPGQADNNAAHAGAAYVFKREGSVWSQQAYIKSSNPELGDMFGWSVSLSSNGNSLAVGSPYESSSATGVNNLNPGQSDNTTPNSGAVYVYTRAANTWIQQAYVKGSNPGTTDSFGISVSLSADGNTLAVGAEREDSAATGVNNVTPGQADNTAIAAGAAYVYTRAGTIWSQQAYIKASNTEGNDRFGKLVSLSDDGKSLAISASNESSSATGINNISPGQADNAANQSGAVYVFTLKNSMWSQQSYIKASNAQADDMFGSSITLSPNGKSLAVGAIGEDASATGINNVSPGQSDNAAPLSGAVYIN